ncbi:neural/ectodermal development factor IMP-L2 [Leptopilina boulardi]|uniref:neural/ectodermal development factor IMP-L2 n=1 Tax=Leptopilina boulardi TaxID=63433 RepID=UPI0021F5295E|nr:neural/ectodermal development factor IMP-L2 [Leptopilina boulardi]
MNLQTLWLSATLTVIITTHGYGFIYQSLEQDVNTMPVPKKFHKVLHSYVSATNPKSLKNAWITVKLRQNNSKLVRTGDRVEFDCELSGSPTPNLHWIRGMKTEREITEILKNGIADASWEGLSRVNGKLVIDCVTPEDEGLIYCAGVAGTEIQLASTLLIVDRNLKGTCRESSKPTITLHASMVISNLESTVIIPCRASGNPRPQTYWLDNYEKRINSNIDSRYSVLENGDLLIESITWEDMGRFLCVAKSGDFEVSVDTFLYPLKPAND